MAGPSTTTASSSSVCFTHVASSPTNIDCATLDEPPLSGSFETDVESRCNEHFPLNIDSDWRTIYESDTDEIGGTTVVPSGENTCSVVKEANIDDCGVAETTRLDPECNWKMHTTTSSESYDDTLHSSVVTSDLPTFVDPDPWKSVAMYSSPKVLPLPVMPIVDIRTQTGYCAITASSEFVGASAISVTVPMATHITTCVPLISTCQTEFNVSSALLPSLQLVTTTSLLSNVTVVLVAADSGATYSCSSEVLAPQPYDFHSSASSSESPGIGHSVTVSGDTSSRCCHVSWSRRHPLTSVTSRHVDRCTSPCLSVASPLGCLSRVVPESVSVYGPCVNSAASRVLPKEGLDTRSTFDPGVSSPTPHVGVVCNSVIPPSVSLHSVIPSSLESPAQPLTITAHVPVPLMPDSSGRLTVLPSRVKSLVTSDRQLACDAKQTRRENNKCHEKSTEHAAGGGTHRVAMQRNEEFSGCGDEDKLMKSHLEGPVKHVRGSCNVEYESHIDPCSELIQTPAENDVAPLGDHRQAIFGDIDTSSVSITPFSCGLYSAVAFPQTSCMVVGSIFLPRVSSYCSSRIKRRRNVTRRSNSRVECDFPPYISPVTSCNFAMHGVATSHDSPPDYVNVAHCGSRHHDCTLDPDHCSEAWRNAHAVPREIGRRHDYQPALYPLPPVIMAPGIFRCPKVWLSFARLVISSCCLNAF